MKWPRAGSTTRIFKRACQVAPITVKMSARHCRQIMASGSAVARLCQHLCHASDGSAAANPAAYGFTNVTQPVWNGNLTDSHSGTLAATGAAQNGYLFADDLHSTAAGHALPGRRCHAKFDRRRWSDALSASRDVFRLTVSASYLDIPVCLVAQPRAKFCDAGQSRMVLLAGAWRNIDADNYWSCRRGPPIPDQD